MMNFDENNAMPDSAPQPLDGEVFKVLAEAISSADTGGGAPDRPEGVSEAAELIARLIPHLPEKTVLDLGRLLQRHTTRPDPGGARYVRLGLLMELVADGHGVLPATREYEAERAMRVSRGEDQWPAHSTLINAYGTWVRAVRAAMLLVRDGTSSKVSSANHHTRFEPSYSLKEVLDALIACRDAIGEWPTEGEYTEWRRAARDLARNAGKPAPRYPVRGAWARIFPGWEEFLAAAKRAAEAAT